MSASFDLFSSSYYSWQKVICRCLDSNRGHLCGKQPLYQLSLNHCPQSHTYTQSVLHSTRDEFIEQSAIDQADPPPDLNRWEFGSREDQLIEVIIFRWSLNFWRRERERERKMIEIVSRYFRQLLALLIFHPTSKYYKVLQHFWSLFRASIFCSLQSFIIFRPPSTPTLVAFIGVISTHGPRFAYSIQVYNINFTTKALSFCDIF